MRQENKAVRREYDAANTAREIVDIAVDKKASDVTLLEIGKATTLAEYFVVATASSDRMLQAISRAVRDAMSDDDIALIGEEGPATQGWVLLDYGQVVVHLFSPEQRDYYDLERRWNEAPTLLKIQ